MNIRKLPIGIQSFEKLRAGNYLYVDKTEFIYQLVNTTHQCFFNRPRRFGKSLLLSTMKAYFEGKKELFTGLKIAKLEKGWIKYPVIYFDFMGADYSRKGKYEEELSYILSEYEEIYEADVDVSEWSLHERFSKLIKAAHKKTGHGVVVLVDEYDKPMLETEGELKKHNDSLFRSFFCILKSSDEHIQFSFMTGITKFMIPTVFADLNHFNIISLSNDYSTICGFTQSELENVFEPEIQDFAKKQNLSVEECLAKIKQKYFGYKFSECGEGVYNSFGILLALANKDFSNYWFTSYPDLLIEKLKKSHFDARELSEGFCANDQCIFDLRDDNSDPIPLFYQTGYLTIKDFSKKYNSYILSYPNDEIKYAFLDCLIPYFTQSTRDSTSLDICKFYHDFEDGKLDSVMSQFQEIYADLPKSDKDNKYTIDLNFQNIIYIVFILLGEGIKVEQHFSFFQTDCIVQTDDYIYIFNFNFDKSADEALQQIEEKKYAEPFINDKRKFFKIGVTFDSKERNITEWKVK